MYLYLLDDKFSDEDRLIEAQNHLSRLAAYSWDLVCMSDPKTCVKVRTAKQMRLETIEI